MHVSLLVAFKIAQRLSAEVTGRKVDFRDCHCPQASEVSSGPSKDIQTVARTVSKCVCEQAPRHA